jgi:hypothetical protein
MANLEKIKIENIRQAKYKRVHNLLYFIEESREKMSKGEGLHFSCKFQGAA